MRSAERFPGVDPQDGKLKWYDGDTFTLRFPLDLTLVDLKGVRVPYNVFPSDIVKTTFRTKLEKELVYEFVNTNIKNNQVDLEFTPEISKKFRKGDYIMEMKLYGNENNFYYPTQEDFEKIESMNIDTDTMFSVQHLALRPGEIEMIGDGVIMKSTPDAVSKYGQLHSPYVFPIKIELGTEYVGSRVAVKIEGYDFIYYTDVIDKTGCIHFLFDAFNFVGKICKITIVSGLFETKYYEFILEDDIGFQDTATDYIDTIGEFKAGNMVIGHKRQLDTLDETDIVFGNITYTEINHEKKAIIPLWTRIPDYFGQTVDVVVDDGEKHEYTVESSGRLAIPVDTNLLAKPQYVIRISKDGQEIKTIILDTHKVSPIVADEFDKDNIPIDCMYVGRCAYNKNFTRCPNCPLKDKSRIKKDITKTLLSDCCNEVQVL